MNDFICFLDRWQTLITGLLATLAAGAPIFLLQRQVRLQKAGFDAEQKRLRDVATSQNWSARARLPDALSEICEYANACYLRIFERNGQQVSPERPREAIASVKQAIEHADPISAKALYDLVVHFQIHNARLRRRGRALTQDELAQRGYDAVLLLCLCNRLFQYGRNEEDHVSQDRLTREMMGNAHVISGGIEARQHRNAELNDAVGRLIDNKHDD